jgi:hypothetical protein
MRSVMICSLELFAGEYLSYHSHLNAEITLTTIYSDLLTYRANNIEPSIVWLINNVLSLPEL